MDGDFSHYNAYSRVTYENLNRRYNSSCITFAFLTAAAPSKLLQQLLQCFFRYRGLTTSHYDITTFNPFTYSHDALKHKLLHFHIVKFTKVSILKWYSRSVRVKKILMRLIHTHAAPLSNYIPHDVYDGNHTMISSNTRNREEVDGSFVVPTQAINSSQHDIYILLVYDYFPKQGNGFTHHWQNTVAATTKEKEPHSLEIDPPLVTGLLFYYAMSGPGAIYVVSVVMGLCNGAHWAIVPSAASMKEVVSLIHIGS
ncbi:Major facilitator superfamily domain, general substrate transporter [Artemisia annua]|uniref:Major facilitator superfamily domain, general substrate transporter n=1 Tax=Artemisia annua TaxID=35608 RepID=A0A2U1KJ71_ARTAN|nr:Major facilitator superfamily domain, general substrate transporter [Artemisia annua]